LLPVPDKIDWTTIDVTSIWFVITQSVLQLLYVSQHIVACVHKLPEQISYSLGTPTGASITCREIFDYVQAHSS